jgi:hypothetical protein
MSRDMKPRKNQPAKKKAAGGTLVGMFIGLVIGVAIAAGVVFYLNKSPLPFVERAQPPAKAEGQAANGQPLALPGKPGDPIPEKRFQFYDILPGKADAVPDKAPKPDAKKEEPKKEEKKGRSRRSPRNRRRRSSCRPARSARRRMLTTKRPSLRLWDWRRSSSR